MKTRRDDLAARAKAVAKDRDAVLTRRGANAAEKTAAREQAKIALKDLSAQQAELKGELTSQGKAIKAMTVRSDRIAAELRKFTAEQKRFDAAVAAVGVAEAAVATGSIDLATVTAVKRATQALLEQAQQDKRPKPEIAALRKELAKQTAAVSKAKGALDRQQKSLKGKTSARDAYTLRKYAAEGIVTLSKDLVEAMKKAGFTWGGDWKVHKDIMHFDMP